MIVLSRRLKLLNKNEIDPEGNILRQRIVRLRKQMVSAEPVLTDVFIWTKEVLIEILDLLEHRLTGDRPLTEHEKRLFLTHDHEFSGMIREEIFKGGEPTLHDVVLIELFGRQEAQTNIIIKQGIQIQMLETNIELLAEIVKGFEEMVRRRS